MEIEILSRETIRPTTPTQPHLRWHQLSALDQLAPQMTFHLVLFYPVNGGDLSPPAHRETVLKTSLSRLLTSFYPLAGRLRKEGPPPHGMAAVECTDEGVPFTVARADMELDLVLQDDNSQLDYGEPLLHLRLTHFSCASSALGICIAHQVADSSSFSLLLNAWSSSARLCGVGPQLTPHFTAASIFPPLNPMTSDLILPLTADSTRAARAQGLTNLCLIVSLRPRLSPPVGDDVFGNTWVMTATTTEEGIREALSKIDGEYARRVMAGRCTWRGTTRGGRPSCLVGF
ncbi:Vinorine synthase [Acorus calamus]|uniref:Vinorine synthase n=1 Tax=Acorus calamus TaxID=4465 RepID=A0AAV9ERC8_ACOCL|nr:Vinorine synthase [Acorus calamus]